MVKELHGGEKDAKSPALLIHTAPRRSINLCKISKPVSSISFEVWLSRCCIKSSALPGMSQHVTLTATCTAGRCILKMRRDIPQPRVPVTAVGNCKAVLTPAKLWGDPLHSCRRALPGRGRAVYKTQEQRNGVFWYSGWQKWEQNQLLNEKGPRKSQGIEMHCFRLY